MTSEVGKPIEEIVADGLAKIANLSGNSKVLALSNLAAIIGHAVGEANGSNTTLHQHIIASPLVYNPDILNSPIPTTPPVTTPAAVDNSSVADAAAVESDGN